MQPFLREVYVPKEVLHLSESESRSETVEHMNEIKRSRMNKTRNDLLNRPAANTRFGKIGGVNLKSGG